MATAEPPGEVYHASTSGEMLRSGEAIKAGEREARGKDDESMLDSVEHPARSTPP